MKSILIFITILQVFYLNNYGYCKGFGDDIERQFHDCMKEAGTSDGGMGNCYVMAAKLWDKEINKYYKLLMEILKPIDKQKLTSDQNNWSKWRESNHALTNAIYSQTRGSAYLTCFVANNLKITKNRAIELHAYYRDLLDQK